MNGAAWNVKVLMSAPGQEKTEPLLLQYTNMFLAQRTPVDVEPGESHPP